MPTILQVLKSKSVQYAIVIAVLSVLQGFVFLLPLTPIQQMFVGIVIAVGITVFRAITTTALSQK